MPDSILPKLADETLKPASSIIDALIAPKIARLRAWAVERDIKSHLNDDKLDKAFAAYLRRLMKRVSSVTTLVFPQQALDMEVIYEPLTLVQRYQQVLVSATDVCQCGVRTYIVDDAGMGKSTFAKHLVLEQIRSSDRIPVLLELRRITKEQTLIDAIAGELDSFGSAFDRQILPQLLSSGRFILVLDGFDEIPVDERLGRARQIEEIATKGEETTVLVTARPEVDLPAMPDVSVMQFKPLSKEQAKSLLLRYDKVGKFDYGRRLIQEIDTVPDRFLETPLLVALLYRTFSYNGAISTRVTSFYDEIYTALYKGHDLTKVGFTREKKSGLDVEDFRRLLRGFGFLMVAKEIESFSSESNAIALIEEAVKLTSISPTSSANFWQDLLAAVPLMFRDGSEFRFLHKTIGEFFAAEYLSNVRDGDGVIAKILKSNLRERFNETFDFLAELNPPLFRRSIAAVLAKDVLDFTPPTGNPIVDMSLFRNSGLSFALVRAGFPNVTFNRNDCYISLAYVGAVDEKPCTLVLHSYTSSLEYPRAAWRLITTDIKRSTSAAHETFFNELHSLAPDGQPLSLTEFARFTRTAQEFITYFLSIPLTHNAEERRKNADGLRILSRELAENLLASVAEEEKTHESLNDLLGG